MNPVQETIARFTALRQRALVVGIIALLASAAGFALAGRTQFFQSYLFAYMVWMCLTLGLFGLTSASPHGARLVGVTLAAFPGSWRSDSSTDAAAFPTDSSRYADLYPGQTRK
jgi:hypothetical protein